jgi:hypothetical protein
LFAERSSSEEELFMKILKSFFLALIMSLTLVQGANAVLYTNVVKFDPPQQLSGQGIFNWQHAVTPDFQVPFDTVNRATLTITAKRATDQNDYLSILNFDFGQLGTLDAASGNGKQKTVFDLGQLGVFTTSFGWASGQPLQLALYYDQGTGKKEKLTLISSLFRLNYTNVEAPVPAPVPEPTTLLLLGGGLVALAVVRRRKQL